MKRKRGLVIAISAVVVIAAAAAVIASGEQEVSAVAVQKGTISRQVEDTAIVQTAEEYKLYATQNAITADISIEIGQVVEKGQILLTLQNPDLELQLAETKTQRDQAEAALVTAQTIIKRLELESDDASTNFDRIEKLFNQGAVSQSEYEQARLRVENSAAALKEQNTLIDSARSQLAGIQTLADQLQSRQSELQLISPISGTVLDVQAKERQPVLPGTLLITLGSQQKMELKADILSDDLAHVQVGQSVFITAPVLADKVLSGQVTKIYPQAEEKTSALGVIQRRVPVIISLEDSANLQPGYEVRAAIETDRLENTLLLPIESVRSLADGGKQVLLINDNRVQFQKVTTGLSDGKNIQIKDGLEEGAVVVQDASLDLKENTRVKGGL